MTRRATRGQKLTSLISAPRFAEHAGRRCNARPRVVDFAVFRIVPSPGPHTIPSIPPLSASLAVECVELYRGGKTCEDSEKFRSVYTSLFATISHSTVTKQEARLKLTNLRDAFIGQSRSPNSTIPYVRHSFLLCNSNFVFKTRRFYDIRPQK